MRYPNSCSYPMHVQIDHMTSMVSKSSANKWPKAFPKLARSSSSMGWN